MVIGITGTSGFIGSSLRNWLVKARHQVIAFIRHPGTDASTERFFDLESSFSPGIFRGIDILVHCAFVHPAIHKDAGSIDYEGTKKMVMAARDSGVRKIIFFSTVSAHEEALSIYGQTKYREEGLFDLQADVILKCGLVVGKGGLFFNLLQQVLSANVVPLIKKGRQPMQVIAIDDVVRAVSGIIEKDLRGLFILANRQQLTYKEMFLIIGSVWKRRLLFIPLPVILLSTAVKVAGVLHISLPFNKENIAGLEALRYFDPGESLIRLSLRPMDLQEKLSEIKEGKAL